MQYTRFLVLGDSFSEGMSDEIIDGKYRGWADRVADVLAVQKPGFKYANLAIRGKLVQQVLDDQVPLALPLIDGRQTLVSFHAGANDALRPNYNHNAVRTAYVRAVTKLVESGATVMLFTVLEKNGNGGKASAVWEERMSTFNKIVREVADKFNLLVMDASMDPESSNPNLLAFDRLHLNVAGHYRVAQAVLENIGAPFDSRWREPVVSPKKKPMIIRKAITFIWFVTFALPWVWRRIRGRSSGDGRSGKYTSLTSWPPTR
jgi:lysophospholipase L1-like esterase